MYTFLFYEPVMRKSPRNTHNCSHCSKAEMFSLKLFHSEITQASLGHISEKGFFPDSL